MTIFQIIPLAAAVITANVGLVIFVADKLSPTEAGRRSASLSPRTVR